MKIGIFTDVHANYPALEAALAALETMQVDFLVHLGDVIAIGPQPSECLERLLNVPNIIFIRGNHDDYFVHGLPEEMGEGERRQQRWTHEQVDDALVVAVAQWPLLKTAVYEGVTITFIHYALKPQSREFATIVRQPTVVDLDSLFGHFGSDLVFYGHHHPKADTTGKSRYVNPGSLGCAREAVARFALLECENGRYTLTHHAVPYDDFDLTAAFRHRNVPERHFLNRIFFGNRLDLGRS